METINSFVVDDNRLYELIMVDYLNQYHDIKRIGSFPRSPTSNAKKFTSVKGMIKLPGQENRMLFY